VLLASAQLSPLAYGQPSTPIAFKDGDRIVFVGDTLIERDQRHGYLETLLTVQNPDKNLTFRNLGWSGDTVEGVSRAGFDPPEAGFEQLRQQILAAKPTVMIVAYGMADSFAGAAGIPRFEKGLNRLLDVIAETHARIILLSPIAHENLGPPLPDPARHNRELERYTRAIGEIAGKRKGMFVDLYSTFPPRSGERRFTDNGIHPTPDGFKALAEVIDQAIVPKALQQPPKVVLAADGKLNAQGARVDQIETTSRGIRFKLTPNLLSTNGGIHLAAKGLPPGTVHLTIDGRPVASHLASEWAQGVTLPPGLDAAQYEKLRQAINRKNELFFYRWRPQNQTYLFGFRKHEQGNNAVEIPRFDPLIAEMEREIAALRKPATHLLELARAEGQVNP
jgi:lysophospholipase L1-like esterase